MRALGLDIGEKRIGVAVCDAEERLASPLCTITPARDRAMVISELAKLIEEYEIEVLVVGRPRHLNGLESKAERNVARFADSLLSAFGVPLVWVDERFTTTIAHRSLDSMGVDNRKRRALVDQLAAATILQTWIDRRTAQESNHGTSPTD